MIEPIDTNEYCMNTTITQDKGVRIVITKINEIISHLNSLEKNREEALKKLNQPTYDNLNDNSNDNRKEK